MAKKDTSEIKWAAKPPPKQKTKVPIVRPKAAQTLRFFLLDQEVTGVWTHWIGGRTQPCLGEVCECVNWPASKMQRWKGYCMAVQKEGFPLCLVEITPEAYRDCSELQDTTRSLRGSLLTLRRLGTKPNGKVVATVQYSAINVEKPSPISCKEALWEVWFSEGEARLTQAKIAGLGINFQQSEVLAGPSEGDGTVPLPKTDGDDKKGGVQ